VVTALSKSLIRLAGFALLMIIVMELGSRVLQLVPPANPETDVAAVLHYTDPNGRVRLTPNWEGTVGFVRMRINDGGFRDRVFTPTPPAGVVRIAVLGDGFTMGNAVPLEASYPKQLETLYEEGSGIEVMNVGVMATNTAMQLHVLEDVLNDYRPHLIVLGYTLDDFEWHTETHFEGLARSGQPFTVQADGRVRYDRSGRQRLKSWIRDHSYLYRSLAALKNRYVQRRGTPADMSHAPQVRSWIDAGGAEKSFAALRQMAQLCQRNGVPFVVAILPAILETSPSLPAIADHPFLEEHDLVHRRMTALGIDFVDMLPAFAGENPRTLVAHPFDRHFSAHGNALIARALKKYLEPKVALLREWVRE
jgi:lysophospholipase L1-like esterase